MSTRLKALRTLVKVRERQADALERALDHARRQQAACGERLDAAVAHERGCIESEGAAVRERDELTAAAFTPDALQALDFRIEDRRAATREAGRASGEARAAVDRAAAAVQQAQAAVRRNERRIAHFRDQVDELLRERAAADDELADEESEEAAIARFVARVRRQRAAQAQEAGHG